MMLRTTTTGAALGILLALGACETVPKVEGTFPPAMEMGEPKLPPGGAVVQSVEPGEAAVRGTIMPATQVPPGAPPTRITTTPAGGDVRLNFPGVPVADVAKAVLGDILKVQYSVAPGLANPVTLVTPLPISRSSVLPLFENALKAAGLALVPQSGGFQIMSAEQAKGSAPELGAGQGVGFGRETIRLQFVGAEELKKLIDPVLPGVVTGVEPATNSLIVAGTSGQRQSVRDLIRQFDVNWLRGVSFGLFVPQRVDARLIVPELDKVLNGANAPTRGLVRLIAMERLNGILAVTGQAQYLQDVRRWIDILDREGESAQPKLFVYRVQNGRAADLAQVLSTAFSGGGVVNSRQPGAVDAIGTGRQFGSTPGRSDNNQQQTGGRTGFSSLGNVPTTLSASGVQSTSGGGASEQTAAQTAANRLAAAARGLAAASGQGGAGAVLGGATITSDESNNAILVYGTPADYAVIEGALRQLDIAPAQVMIEASISEVTLTDDLRYGVQAMFSTGNSNIVLSDAAGTNSQLVPPGLEVPLTRVVPGFSFLYSTDDIKVILNALEGLTTVNVLSSPKLLVINNQTAALQVGNQVPTIKSTNTSSDFGVQNEIEYRDTGVILNITPRVNAGGLVLLDIAQEVSQVTSPSSVSAASQDSPTFSTRRIATSIAVQDGQTIALGGLISDSRERGRTGLPYLSRIPIIGGLLFGRTNNSTMRTELLILLRPRVIRSFDDGRAITDELIAKIQTAKGLLPEQPAPPKP